MPREWFFVQGDRVNADRRAGQFAVRVGDYLRERRKNLAFKIGRVQWGPHDINDAVALTFDDGPHPRFTPEILDLLRRFGVKATFFLVGVRAREHPEIVERIMAEGHCVASHTDTHPDMWTLSPRAAMHEYRVGRDTVSDIAGHPVRICRPPKGSIGVVQACITRRLGLRPWLWTLAGQDWLPGITVPEILAEIGTAKAGDVILLHDGLERPIGPAALDRSATVQALEQLIPEIQSRGLRFVALT